MLWSNCKIKVHGDFFFFFRSNCNKKRTAADTERRSLSRAEDGGCLEMNGTLNSGAPPAQLESCPAATETDIHANHNRNDRPGHHTTRPDSHFKPDLPASQPASPDRQQATPPEVPPLCLRRQTGTNWAPPPPPLSITTHSSSPLRAAAASAQGANSTFRSPFVLIMLT